MTPSDRLAAYLLLLTICHAITVRAADAPAPPPLGSPDAVASIEHPFGFRGDGSGRFPGATPLTEWSGDKNIRWNTRVGPGYSSPILTGQSVIVTSEPDLLICLARADGKEQWRLRTTPADVPDDAGRKAATDYEPPKNGSGQAAATPVTDGQTVYLVFANGIVRAVGVDGKPKWTACIDAPPTTGYGRAASPILVDGKLIVHMSGLYAFDRATGKQLWANADAKSTYATPASLKVGTEQMIVTPAGDVVGAADGKAVASAIGMAQQASPIIGADGIIYFAGDSTDAIRLGPKYKDEEAWSGPGTGDTFSSPVLADDTLFVVNGEGKLFAFDAKGKGDNAPLIDGRPLVDPHEGAPAVFSSLTQAGKYLFLVSNSGEMVVLEATREAKLVAKNHLSTGGGASPVFSGKDIFLRDGDRLVCIGN